MVNNKLTTDWVQRRSSEVLGVAFTKAILSILQEDAKIYQELNDFRVLKSTDVVSRVVALLPPEVELHPDIIERTLSDFIMIESLWCRSLYYLRQSKNYLIAKDFFDEFKKIQLKGLRFRDLPIGSGYIHFPTPIEDAEGSKFDHCYFLSGLSNEEIRLNLHRHRAPTDKTHKADGNKIIIVTVINDTTGEIRNWSTKYPKDENMDLQTWFDGADEYLYDIRGGVTVKKAVFGGISAVTANVLAYLNSGQPDISQFKNHIRYRGNSKTKPINADRDLSLLPIELVGFNWLKSNYHSEDAWLVKSHFRWQRYGPGLCNVKLVTIKEHEKSWKNPTAS